MIAKDHSVFGLLGLVVAVHLMTSGCAPQAEEGESAPTPEEGTPSAATAPSQPSAEPSLEPAPSITPAVAPTPQSAELADVLAEMEQIQVRGIELSKELTRIETEARGDTEITALIADLEALRESQDQQVLDWIKSDNPESAEQVEQFVSVGKQLEEMQFESPEEGSDAPSIEEQQALRTSLVTEYQELELALSPILQGVREQDRFLELQGTFTNQVQQVQDALFSKMEGIEPQVTEWRAERDQLADRFSALREQANTIQLRSMAPATELAPGTPSESEPDARPEAPAEAETEAPQE